ncbi:MAG: hypothetical protein ACJ72E_10720 [Marmoricola sp.]
MRRAGVAVLAAVLLSAAACGSASKDSAPPSKGASGHVCAAIAADEVDVNLVGGGRTGTVGFAVATGAQCPARLIADSAVTDPSKSYEVALDDLPLARHGLRALTIPGRTGQLVLLVQTQPRGGYQAHLFGYADDRFEELEVDGHPVLPFVATDTGDTLLTARCEHGGVTVETAKSSGKRTWDVARTPYLIEGNRVSPGTTVEIARDVSGVDLPKRYPDLVAGTLFADCT